MCLRGDAEIKCMILYENHAYGDFLADGLTENGKHRGSITLVAGLSAFCICGALTGTPCPIINENFTAQLYTDFLRVDNRAKLLN